MQTNDTLILGDARFATLKEDELHKAKLLAKPTQKLAVRADLTFNGCVILLKGNRSITF